MGLMKRLLVVFRGQLLDKSLLLRFINQSSFMLYPSRYNGYCEHPPDNAQMSVHP